MHRKHTTIAAVATLLAASGFLLAGPLNPPSGPVGPTGKTLTEVEPRTAINAANTPGNGQGLYVISQPGSYYLTGDISVPTGKAGIYIMADPVTVDLNGFSILGTTGSTSGVTTAQTYYYNTTVKNGSCAGFPVAGVDLSNVWGGHVQNVTTNSNGVGVKLLDGLVESCTAVYNTTGFSSNGHAEFLNCTATHNNAGFASTAQAVFERCTSSSNSGRGFDVGVASTVRNCIVEGNSLQGIVCTDSCMILNNVVSDNGGSNNAGIWVTGVYDTVDGNEVINNGFGIYVGSSGGTLVVRNHVGSSTQSNFYIVAGNHVGAIASVSSNALINGSSGGGLGTTDPYANFVR
jgi:parallel beta-helix repeat protein